MRDYNLKTLYSQSLGIKAAWKIASVTRTEDEIHMRVECYKRATWTDPETKQRALIKDWHERTWRHTDTCECKTLVTCRVPHIELKGGRTKMVQPPWALTGGRFTRHFETHIIPLLSQTRTVRGAARLARVTEDQVDGVMQRAVARGLLGVMLSCVNVEVWHRLPAAPLRNRVEGCSQEGHFDSGRLAGCPPLFYSVSGFVCGFESNSDMRLFISAMARLQFASGSRPPRPPRKRP